MSHRLLKGTARLGLAVLGVFSVAIGSARAEMGELGTSRAVYPPFLHGWRDELDDPRLWQPLAGVNAAIAAPGRRGALKLRMPPAREGFPHSYQWGGVTRTATVDLERYPVLVASIRSVGEGSYAHLDVEERVGLARASVRTPAVHGPGLSVLDLGKEWGPRRGRVHLRLIVGGPLSGASAEYAWIRFVRREEVPCLKRGEIEK